MLFHKLLSAACISIFTITTAQAAIISTPTDSNNGQRGIMFDVMTSSNDITFESLGVDIYTGTTANYEFYTILGGVTGNTESSAGWTLHDTFDGVFGFNDGIFNQFDISDFTVAANTTIGFYFTNTAGGGVGYTNATVGSVRASNSDLTILSGYGKSYPFDITFTGRGFNGSITYSQANSVSEPGVLALLILGLVGISLKRKLRLS